MPADGDSSDRGEFIVTHFNFLGKETLQKMKYCRWPPAVVQQRVRTRTRGSQPRDQRQPRDAQRVLAAAGLRRPRMLFVPQESSRGNARQIIKSLLTRSRRRYRCRRLPDSRRTRILKLPCQLILHTGLGSRTLPCLVLGFRRGTHPPWFRRGTHPPWFRRGTHPPWLRRGTHPPCPQQALNSFNSLPPELSKSLKMRR